MATVSPQKKILILTRGTRLAELLYETSKNLAENYHVICTLHTYVSKVRGGDLSSIFRPAQNLTFYDMSDGIRDAYREFLNSGQDQAEFLKNVEKELGLTLYKSASNFHYYRRFSKSYNHFWDGYCDSESDVVEEFLGAYLFFTRLLDEHQPSLVFCEVQDVPAHRVAAALAQNRNIFVVANSFDTTCRNSIMLTSGVERRSVLLEHYYSNPHLIREKCWQDGKELIEKFSQNKFDEHSYINHRRKRNEAGLLKNLWSDRKRFLEPIPPGSFKRTLSRAKNLRWLNRVMKTSIPEGRYILILLHHQPEAALGLAAPRWIDQNAIAEQLAATAPAGMKIVIKENPATFGLRGREYFGHLLDFPNVHLLHPSVNSRLAIKDATVVFTVSGTAGLEGLLMKKRVATLGTPFYAFFEGNIKLNYPDEIYQLLDQPFPKSKNYDELLLRFAASYVQSLFPIGESIPGQPWPYDREGGVGFAQAIHEFNQVVEQQSLKPDQFNLTV